MEASPVQTQRFRSFLDRYIHYANPLYCWWLQQLKFPPEKIIETWPNQEPKFNHFGNQVIETGVGLETIVC